MTETSRQTADRVRVESSGVDLVRVRFQHSYSTFNWSMDGDLWLRRRNVGQLIKGLVDLPLEPVDVSWSYQCDEDDLLLLRRGAGQQQTICLRNRRAPGTAQPGTWILLLDCAAIPRLVMCLGAHV